MFNKLPVRRDFYALTHDGAGRHSRHGWPDRLRLVERGEPVHHRRPQHDRRRAGRQGQDAEQRLHPGSRSQDRRTARRIRPHDRRRRQRPHQERRQPVPADRSSDSARAARCRPTTAPRTSGRHDDHADRRHRAPGATSAVELGGFIVKDRLWFFGAYNRVNERDDTTVIRDDRVAGRARRSARSFRRRSTAISTREADRQARLGPHAQLQRERRPVEARTATCSRSPARRARSTASGRSAAPTWSAGTTACSAAASWSRAWSAATRRTTSSAAPAATSRTSSTRPWSRLRPRGGFGFFQDQDFNRNVVKADVTMYLGGHDIKGGGDYEHIKAVNNNFNGGAGQRIYKLSTSRWHGTVYYRHRFYVNDRAPGFVPRRSVHLADRPAADLRAGLAEHLVLRAGQLAAWARLHHQRRHPLGSPGRPQPRRRVRVQARRQLGAARRLHLGRDAQQPQQALRELGPLLREHPDGHQHPGVRRRAAVLLLQLRSRSRRTRFPIRARRLDRACSAAASSRSIRT